MVSDVGRFVRDVLKFRPDAVHVSTSGHLAFVRDAVIIRAAGLLHVPVVYNLHFGRLPDVAKANSWEWKWARRALNRADIVLALDERTASVLRVHREAAQVVVLPNPIADTRSLHEPEDALRRNVALFVGWVIPSKGIDELVSAWSIVAPPGWTLEIVGPGDPQYIKSLLSRALPDSITLIGPLENSEVLERMSLSRIFLFPSHTEGFPNAVAEAMASGLAVVATDVGAIRSMLRDGAGMVIPPKDTESLAAAVQSVVESPARREQMAARAQARVCTEFRIQRLFAEYVSLWARLSRR